MADICAGITVFESDVERLAAVVFAVYNQVKKIFIVDNGSENIADIKQKLSVYENITFLENGENLGVAKALNRMCEAAAKEEFDFILTLDDDSVPEDKLIDKFAPYLNCENIGIISPNYLDDNEKSPTFPTDKEFEEIDRCITSGSLVKLEAFKAVGGFDGKMFIDCVDFDFCTSLLESGYKIIRVPSAFLHHRLGSATEIKFFVPFAKLLGIKKLQKPLYTYNHSPIRTYYYARNIRYYWAKHKDFLDMKTEKRVYIKWLVLKLGFEKQKLEKLKAISKAKKDAKQMIKELNK